MSNTPEPGLEPGLDPRLEPLIADLLEWIGAAPRPYAEVMEAWRTSCPRLPVWEESVDRGLVVRQAAHGGGPQMVAVTDEGRRFLALRTRRRSRSVDVAHIV